MARATVAHIQQPEKHWWQASAVSWIGLALSIGAMIYTAGSLTERVTSQGAEIVVLRSELRATSATSVQILERLASIDTRLAMMVAKRKKSED